MNEEEHDWFPDRHQGIIDKSGGYWGPLLPNDIIDKWDAMVFERMNVSTVPFEYAGYFAVQFVRMRALQKGISCSEYGWWFYRMDYRPKFSLTSTHYSIPLPLP